MKAGDLRNRIAIRRATRTDNGKGGYTTSWSDVAVVFAKVIGLTGREAVMDQVLQGIQVYRIHIRFRADVLPSDQIRYGAIDLNIKSVNDPDGRSEQLVIIADTESVQAG